LSPPGTAHFLGTNAIGQDMLAVLLAALPGTVAVPFLAALAAMLIGGLFAFIATVGGNLSRTLILRLVDMLQVLPPVFFLLLLAAWTRPGSFGIVLILGLTMWHDDVRVLHLIAVRESSRDSVSHARHMGAGWWYSFVRHVLPAAWPPVLGLYVQNLRGAVMRLAGLGFLGLTDPRLITWGGMIQDGMPYLYGQEWLWMILPPAFALSCLVGALLLWGQRVERRTLALEDTST
jgi:peptide/nickel transport system permease protein